MSTFAARNNNEAAPAFRRRPLRRSGPFAAALATVACVAAGCGTDSTPAASNPVASSDIQVLWTTTADHVRSDGHTLVLDGIAPTVTRFADRPTRAAWSVDLDTFLSRWDPRFDTDPPNATVSWTVPGEGRPRVAAVTLSDPHLDGDRLTFHTSALPVTTEEGVALPPAAVPDGDHVTVTIDSAPLDVPTPVVDPPAGVSWQTTGSDGQQHTLALHLAPAVPGLEQEVVSSNNLLAVVSGTDTYTVDGDAAAADWRFTVDPTRTGDIAPIIVLKFAPQALTESVASPVNFRAINDLTDNPSTTLSRLRSAIASITAAARSDQPDAPYYRQLAALLEDPTWTGVLLFNATVTPPDQVQGSPTPVLPAPVVADAVGFQVARVAPGGPEVSPLFATVNWPGSATAPGGQYLRALFENGALTQYAAGTSPAGDH